MNRGAWMRKATVAAAALAMGVAAGSVRAGAQNDAWVEEAKAEIAEAAALEPDPSIGEEIFFQCAACHKPNGSGSEDGIYPQLAGQHAEVVIKQLIDFRTGNRENLMMIPMAKQLVDAQEIADVAAYIESLPVQSTNGKGPGSDLAAGEKIYKESCERCHGDKGQGDAASVFPAIASQQYLYVKRQLTDMKSGTRKKANPEMLSALAGLSDAQIDAVSDFVSRMRWPEGEAKGKK